MRHPVVAILLAMTCLVLLSGCSRQYFHESPSGDRYYQTANGDILRVSRSGAVWKGSEQLGVAKKAREGEDWNLSSYAVVPPSGHCISALNKDIAPAPCWALLWQVPLQILASPFVAAQQAFEEGNISFAGAPSKSVPTAENQQREHP